MNYGSRVENVSLEDGATTKDYPQNQYKDRDKYRSVVKIELSFDTFEAALEFYAGMVDKAKNQSQE